MRLPRSIGAIISGTQLREESAGITVVVAERAVAMQKSLVGAAPARRRFLTAQWRYLVMLNYQVDPALVRPLAPRRTEIDFWAGKTYVSVVGFLFRKTRLLGVPPPWHRNFEEVNLRYYVRRETAGELRRGVGFVKEIVPRWMIATVARLAYNENYVSLPMRHRLEDSTAGRDDGPLSAVYEWRANGQWQSVAARGQGAPQPLIAGSHEEFITEHYWGYCTQRDGGTIEYQVEHPRWNVWQAAEATLDCDAVSLYGEAFGEVLARKPDTAFIADGSEVAVYRPARIC
jgi:uncharacterized protein YqjF (DUF2071 family)